MKTIIIDGIKYFTFDELKSKPEYPKILELETKDSKTKLPVRHNSEVLTAFLNTGWYNITKVAKSETEVFSIGDEILFDYNIVLTGTIADFYFNSTDILCCHVEEYEVEISVNGIKKAHKTFEKDMVQILEQKIEKLRIEMLKLIKDAR